MKKEILAGKSLFFRLVDVIYPDKTLSRKSDEREVKLCKNRFFILYSSFFILRKHSFRTAKHKLWPRQRSCFIASNMTFHTTKHGLSRDETLPLVNSDFVNREITDENPCNYLLANILRKTQKNAFFSTKRRVGWKECILEGSKFEYYLTNVIPAVHALRGYW